MTVKEFFDAWNNKPCDFDKVYGFQCVDIFKQFNKDVVGAPNVNGNAIDYFTTYPTDFYTKKTNTPTNFPLLGDVIIWGKTVGQYGHIAICSEATKDSFTSFDQNWPLQVDSNGNGLGVCHYQAHNYNGVLGWLHPKSLPEPQEPSIPPETDPNKVKVDLGPDYGVLEVQAIKSKLGDNQKTIESQERTNVELIAQVQVLQDHQKAVSDKLMCANTQEAIMGAIASLIALEDQSNNTATVDPLTQLINMIISLFKKKGGK